MQASMQKLEKQSTRAPGIVPTGKRLVKLLLQDQSDILKLQQNADQVQHDSTNMAAFVQC